MPSLIKVSGRHWTAVFVCPLKDPLPSVAVPSGADEPLHQTNCRRSLLFVTQFIFLQLYMRVLVVLLLTTLVCLTSAWCQVDFCVRSARYINMRGALRSSANAPTIFRTFQQVAGLNIVVNTTAGTTNAGVSLDAQYVEVSQIPSPPPVFCSVGFFTGAPGPNGYCTGQNVATYSPLDQAPADVFPLVHACYNVLCDGIPDPEAAVGAVAAGQQADDISIAEASENIDEVIRQELAPQAARIGNYLGIIKAVEARDVESFNGSFTLASRTTLLQAGEVDIAVDVARSLNS